MIVDRVFQGTIRGRGVLGLVSSHILQWNRGSRSLCLGLRDGDDLGGGHLGSARGLRRRDDVVETVVDDTREDDGFQGQRMMRIGLVDTLVLHLDESCFRCRRGRIDTKLPSRQET